LCEASEKCNPVDNHRMAKNYLLLSNKPTDFYAIINPEVTSSLQTYMYMKCRQTGRQEEGQRGTQGIDHQLISWSLQLRRHRSHSVIVDYIGQLRKRTRTHIAW